MKNRLLLLMLCCLPVLAQQKFTPDAIGRVTDPAFRKLIKERGYTLVCTYYTVSREPLDMHARVLKDGKWVIIDLQGNEIAAPQFSPEEYFTDGLAKIKKGNGNYNLANNEGKVVSAEYENIQDHYYGVAIVSSGNKDGVIGLDGQEVLPLKFDDIRLYPKGILAGCDNKYSLYSFKGEQLTTTKYDMLKWYGPFLKAYKGNTFCLLNSQTGKPLSSEWYSDEKNFLSTLAAAKIDDAYIDYTVMLVNNGTHCFLLDKNGTQLGDKYEYIAEVSEQYYMGYNDADCWLLDEKGNRVAKSVKYPGETSMLIDDKGKSLGASLWREYDSGNIFVTQEANGRYHYFDRRMEELDFSAYDKVIDFANGRATVEKAGKYGFADYTGRLVIDAVYDNTLSIGSDNGTCAVKRNGKWGVIDNNGGIVQPLEFESINNYGPFCIISKGGKIGVITHNGEEKFAPVYDDIDDLRHMRYKAEQPGLFKVQQNGKWGVVNKELEFILPPVYDNIINNTTTWMDDKILHVKKGGNRYLITLTGEEIMPLDGEIVCCFEYQYRGLFAYAYQDKLYQADLYGNQLLISEGGK